MSNNNISTKNETETTTPASSFEKESLSDIISIIQNIKQQMTGLTKIVRDVEKRINKRIKTLEKENKKTKNKGNKQPSGFANPTPVSKKLCEFMHKPHDTKMARTDVTKYIIQYIKEHKLEDPENAKIIKPDNALTSLFNIKDDSEVLTYFNMQRHMNKHFLKKSN